MDVEWWRNQSDGDTSRMYERYTAGGTTELVEEPNRHQSLGANESVIMEKSSGVDYFSTLKRITNVGGLKFTNKAGKWDTIRLWIFPLILYTYAAIVLVRKWSFANDMEDILYATGLGTCIPRITIARLHVSNFADVLDLLENIDLSASPGREKLRASLKRASTLVCKLSGPLVPASMLLITAAWFFSSRDRPLPFITMPEWALNYSPLGCVLIQLCVYTVMAHEYVMVDGLKVCILLHLQIHFRNLSLNIKNIVEQAREESGANGIQSQCLKKNLVNVVCYHDFLLQIAEKVETIYNKCVLSSFINLSLFVCLTMYSMSLFPLLSIEFAIMVFYITIILLLFFVDCFFSQQVMTESEEVAHSCYEIDFVGTDPKFQKALVMIMRTAQNSVKFTIGKFAPLSIVTGVVITKASVSYFMLLQNMKKIQ
ncbi:hypothetical protein RI129_010682 [Pyrocoelia pectoralis]|uniref:Odorant receptor n=1 Tax=Pyrocoelia pectoralis TaxID=417401 RepID=A0AAN7V7E6_9COLE